MTFNILVLNVCICKFALLNSITFDWVSTKPKVARLKQEMLLSLLISRKSRSKSSRFDMRTLEST